MSHRLDADAIYRRIPHAGAMRLLDEVVFWDGKAIVCLATSHMDRDNPLRERGALSNVHALEYAAQAVAVHASLINGGVPLQRVYIATFRQIDMKVDLLDRMTQGPLEIRAQVHAANAGTANYTFTVSCAGAALACGAVTVVMPRDAQ